MAEIIHLDAGGCDEPIPAEQQQGQSCTELIKRFHEGGRRYTETCLGSIVCGLRKELLNPDLNDALGAAKDAARAKGGPVTCGREACGSELENEPERSSYVQPCSKYPDGVYIANHTYGAERPPLQAVPPLPEQI